MSKNNFVFHYVIGRGGFGKVSSHLKIITHIHWLIGLESWEEKDRVIVRYERNVQSKNHNKEISKLGNEWKKTTCSVKTSVSHKLF